MKKVLFLFGAIVFLLILSDYMFGSMVNTYRDQHGLQGDYLPIEHVINDCADDVLVVGSSLALTSLKPSIVEDSLGVSCYNAGANDQTMIYYHTVLNSILNRYTPKMVLLALRPTDLLGEDIRRYNILVPYYRRGYEEIDSVLESRNDKAKYLLRSNLYRYNTIWFRILLYHFMGNRTESDKGFIAHDKPLYPPCLKTSEENPEISENKLALFNDIVSRCKERNISLVVYFPPMYIQYKEKTSTVKMVEAICKEHDIQCFYDTQDAVFMNHPEWFYDNNHLDYDGAVYYTKSFVHRLKSSMPIGNI